MAEPMFDVIQHPGLLIATHDGVDLQGDAFVPDGEGPFPAFVLLHGGAFTKGRRGTCAPWGRFLAAHGYVALAADYRLATPDRTTFPEAIWDVKAAIQLIRGRAAELRVDAARVGAMGGSAGANLAAMVALTAGLPQFDNPYPDEFRAESAAVDVVVAMAGPFDLLSTWRHGRTARPLGPQPIEAYLGGTPYSDRNRYYEASPVYHCSTANATGTKWLIAWGTHDEVSPPELHSLALAQELQMTGALVRLAPLVGAPHYWHMEGEVDDPGSYNQQLSGRLLRFLTAWAGR